MELANNDAKGTGSDPTTSPAAVADDDADDDGTAIQSEHIRRRFASDLRVKVRPGPRHGGLLHSLAVSMREEIVPCVEEGLCKTLHSPCQYVFVSMHSLDRSICKIVC